MVQVAHACLEAGRDFGPPNGAHLVLLTVESEAALLRAVERVQQEGIDIRTFYEPHFPRGFTAACTAPLCGEARRVFRRFALWK